MVVSPQERDAMHRLMQIMNGESPTPTVGSTAQHQQQPVVLAGPGQISEHDVRAMADVLRKLNSVPSQAHMLNETVVDPTLTEAMQTQSMPDGVKIGVYKIISRMDESRVAGKQHFSVVNNTTGETLAHELSLYEAAHSLVRLLNQGMFFNSEPVRSLLEAEAAYTGHKIDAVRYHRMARRLQRENQLAKADLMETRKQSSMDRAMTAKAQVKKIYKNSL
jgi:hypothetical protein